MKQTSPVQLIRLSSILSIAAVALTVLAAILAKNVAWWLTISQPSYQVGFLVAAFWCWTPEDRDRHALFIVSIVRLIAAGGLGLAALVAMLSGFSLMQLGELLQTAASVLFLLGVIMYWKEQRDHRE